MNGLLVLSVLAIAFHGAYAATFYRCAWITNGAIDCGRFSDDVTCGSDLVTYANKCEFSRAHCADTTLDLLHAGACTDADRPTVDPVSGVDVVFDFFCTNLSHQDCPADNQKICATDGWTYPNFCEYEKQKCTHRDLGVVRYGDC